MIQMYWDVASNNAIGNETEFKVDIRGWGMQWPKGLVALDKKLELDKKNDQALNSLINFSLLIL